MVGAKGDQGFRFVSHIRGIQHHRPTLPVKHGGRPRSAPIFLSSSRALRMSSPLGSGVPARRRARNARNDWLNQRGRPNLSLKALDD
jgi:hypothetical protein